MNADFGVKYPCYGEYKCPKCKREWNSNRAWLTTGQKCKSCNEFRKPFRVEPLYSFVCLKKDCGSQWKNKFVDVSLCSKCGNPGKRFETPKQRHEYITANKLAVASPSWGEKTEHVAKSGHLAELCEKCQKSKYKDCRRQAFEDAQKLPRDQLITVGLARDGEIGMGTAKDTNSSQNQTHFKPAAPARSRYRYRSIQQRRRMNETSNYSDANVQQYGSTFYGMPREGVPPWEDAQRLRRDPLWEVTEKLENTHLLRIQKPSGSSSYNQTHFKPAAPAQLFPTLRRIEENPMKSNAEYQSIQQRRRMNETSNYREESSCTLL